MIPQNQLPLKVAITGHTSGIGRAFADWFTNKGHDVLGMSRGNGFDIKYVGKIIDHARDCDIFINNAWQDFDQSLLMYALHDLWKSDPTKLIIAVSSARTIKPVEYHDGNPGRNLYKTSKHSLEESCKHLWNHDPFPRICLFKPGHTTTNFTVNSTRPKMDADQLVSCFMNNMTSVPPDMFVQEICIRESHERQHLG